MIGDEEAFAARIAGIRDPGDATTHASMIQDGVDRSMIIITIEVDCRPAMTQAVKEQIAMDLERYGDVRVKSIDDIKPDEPEQITMF